jgi:hypothetical protein
MGSVYGYVVAARYLIVFARAFFTFYLLHRRGWMYMEVFAAAI